MRRAFKMVALTLAVAAPTAGRLQAQTLGVSYGTYNSSYNYGGSQTGFWTGALNTAFGGAGNVTVVPDLSGNLGLFSAIMVDLRNFNHGFSAAEATNLAAFIASGRRVMIFGENYLWNVWNTSITNLVGGTNTSSTSYSNAAGSTLVNHQLTAGVNSVQTLGAPGSATGGTSLFSNPYVHLWGAQQNVLTLLDVNTCTYSAADNNQFCQNAADWLSQSTQSAVPEPVTMVLLGSGLMGMGGAGFLKRRKGAPQA